MLAPGRLFSPLLLLLGTDAPPMPSALSIVIDPCVEVDESEVRRLTAVELATWHQASALGALEVVVACDGALQQLRLTEKARNRVTVRSIDLNTELGVQHDARARELSLAIAELLRRIDAEHEEEAKPPEVHPVPRPRVPPKVLPEPAPAPHRPVADVGVSAGAAGWTAGEVLFGADLGGRVHFGRWFSAELRVGARKTKEVELSLGTVDGRGAAASLGFAVNALGSRKAGASFGLRLEGTWLRYVVLARDDVRFGSGDAGALSLAGTSRAFVHLAGPVCFTVDAAFGGALHSIDIREEGRLLSGMNGLVVSSAAGFMVEL